MASTQNRAAIGFIDNEETERRFRARMTTSMSDDGDEGLRRVMQGARAEQHGHDSQAQCNPEGSQRPWCLRLFQQRLDSSNDGAVSEAHGSGGHHARGSPLRQAFDDQNGFRHPSPVADARARLLVAGLLGSDLDLAKEPGADTRNV
jgi:hypothetical protein